MIDTIDILILATCGILVTWIQLALDDILD